MPSVSEFGALQVVVRDHVEHLALPVAEQHRHRGLAPLGFGAEESRPIIAAMSMEASSPVAPPGGGRMLKLPPSIQAALPPWLTEPADSAADLAIQSVVLEKLHRLPADTKPDVTQHTINEALDHLIKQARQHRRKPAPKPK